MTTAGRVGMFTPASVAKFTGGAHIRAFMPRALEAMPANVRLKAGVLEDPSIERFEPAIRVANMTGINAHKALPIITDGCVGKQNIIELLRNPDFRNHTGISAMRNNDSADRYPHDQTIAAKLSRIGVPEDTLETMNIAGALTSNISPYNKITMKDADGNIAWSSLTAAYISHMGYEYPREAGAAIGRIIHGSENSWANDMYYAGGRNPFVNSVIDGLFADDGIKKAQAMSAAVMHMYPGDEEKQISSMTEMEKIEGSQPFIFHVMKNWHNWQGIAYAPETSPFIQSAIKFARAAAGDVRLSLMIKAALSQADSLSTAMQKRMDRSSFAKALAQIADGLGLNMSEKIKVLIDTARMVRRDEAISEMDLKDFAAEESIRYLLSPGSV